MDSSSNSDVRKKSHSPGLGITLLAEDLVESARNSTNYPAPNTKTSFHFAISGICFSVTYWKKHSGWMTHLHHPLASKRVFGPFATRSQAFAQCDRLLGGGPDDPRHLGLFPIETLQAAYPNGVFLSSERDRYLAMGARRLKKLGAFVSVFLTSFQGKPVVCCDVSCNGDKQLLELLDAMNNAWSNDDQLFRLPPPLANRDCKTPVTCPPSPEKLTSVASATDHGRRWGCPS
ncbi:MAG: hypothetical protein ABIQ36_10670 [Rhodanobacter sp.]